MTPDRLAYLRAENDAERLSYGDLIEIQSAFEQIDPATLPEPAENAMASDMLDEIEQRMAPCGQSFATPADAEAHRVTCGECAGVEDKDKATIKVRWQRTIEYETHVEIPMSTWLAAKDDSEWEAIQDAINDLPSEEIDRAYIDQKDAAIDYHRVQD